jgi:chromosome segregation ATPase
MRSKEAKQSEVEQRLKKLEAERLDRLKNGDAPLLNVATEFGMEDYKQKYLEVSGRLHEMRQEMMTLKTKIQRQKKVLVKELGSEGDVEKAIATADDPHSTDWRGRAAQVSALSRQVKDLRQQLATRGEELRPVPEDDAVSCTTGVTSMTGAAGAVSTRDDPASSKARKHMSNMAEERRQQLERQAQELAAVKGEVESLRTKEQGARSRTQVLEGQMRELKANVQTLLAKGEHDDETIAALRKHNDQLQTQGGGSRGGDVDSETVREMEEQIQRQSHIILQLRQKTLQQSVEDGQTSDDPARRVRYLDAENRKLQEHVAMLEGQLASARTSELSGRDRPMSAESSVETREQLAQAQKTMNALRKQVAEKEKEIAMVQAELTDTLAAWEEEQKITAEALDQNEALKRELQRIQPK